MEIGHEEHDFASMIVKKVIDLTGYNPALDLNTSFAVNICPSAIEDLVSSIDPRDRLAGSISFRNVSQLHDMLTKHCLARSETLFMRRALLDGTLSTFGTDRVFFTPFTANDADDLFDLVVNLRDLSLDLQHMTPISIMFKHLLQLSRLRFLNGCISVAAKSRAEFIAWAKAQIKIGYRRQNDPLATERPSDSHAWLSLFNRVMTELPARDRIWLIAILRRLRSNRTAHMEKAAQGWRMVSDDDFWYQQWRKEMLENTDAAEWVAQALKDL